MSLYLIGCIVWVGRLMVARDGEQDTWRNSFRMCGEAALWPVLLGVEIEMARRSINPKVTK